MDYLSSWMVRNHAGLSSRGVYVLKGIGVRDSGLAFVLAFELVLTLGVYYIIYYTIIYYTIIIYIILLYIISYTILFYCYTILFFSSLLPFPLLPLQSSSDLSHPPIPSSSPNLSSLTSPFPSIIPPLPSQPPILGILVGTYLCLFILQSHLQDILTPHVLSEWMVEV